MAPVSMICMGMGDHGIINRFPGVDIEFTLGAVDAFVGKLKQRFFSHVVLTTNWGIGLS